MFEENSSSLPAAPLPKPGMPPEPKSATPAAPPPNLPTGQAGLPSAAVEDMFDKTEPVKTAPMPNMNAPMPNAAPAVPPPMVTNRKTIVIASLVLGVLILIGGGIALARFLGKPILGMTNPSSSTPEAVVTETPPEPTPGAPLTESLLTRLNESNEQTPTASSDTALAPSEAIAPKDTDSDGLNDDEETVLGIDIASSDTDKDGLSDYDEVRVYRTDPANADTDGDTFKDGDEVKNGYNPAGAGKIFGAPSTSPATNPPTGATQPQP